MCVYNFSYQNLFEAVPPEAFAPILPVGCVQAKLARVTLFETWILHLQINKAEGNCGPWHA